MIPIPSISFTQKHFTHNLFCILGLILCVSLYTGCQSEIEVDLPDYDSKLVIEGTIENGEPAVVFLSKSIPYFSTMDLNHLMDVLITDAEVYVTSSDGESERLQFQLYPDAPLFMAFVSQHLRGKENTSYTLTVRYDGKEYTAVTTIPHTFDLDSIWFDCPSDLINTDTIKTIRLQMTDNPNETNFYGFKLKVACPKFTDRLWISSVPIVFDDKTFNGCTFNYELERFGITSFMTIGMDEHQLTDYNRITFRPGDTVYVKHSLMDYNTYQFMMTGGNDAIMGSNPFTNPAPVASNIQGENVLGAWCGFASKVDRLIWNDTVGYYNQMNSKRK